MSDKVVVLMDDLELAVRANAALEAAGFQTTMVSSFDDAASALRRSDPDLLLLTGALHESSIRPALAVAQESGVPSVGLTEPGEPDPHGIADELALTAIMRKPVEAQEVAAAVRRVLDRVRLQERTGIIGNSAPIQEVLIKIEQMAPVTSTVLIEGESGTGKELVARAIHDLSPRRGKPFIAVSCAALPETLLESELFGHEKGAFTGAAERRLGRFELADGGTIFLDEVGELPPSTQVKLLRVLEERSFFRVGGAAPIAVNVRVIAATNKALREAVALGEFRDDLYFRLNVLSIYLPPLRQRRSDIPMLVRRFIRELAQHHDRAFQGITPEALAILVEAQWPGNVRQLRNLVESMVVLAPGAEIRASDIPPDVRLGGSSLVPVRLTSVAADGASREMEFILRSLLELRLEVERLRHRLEDVRQPVEVIEVSEPASYEVVAHPSPAEPEAVDEGAVVYRAGMTMAEMERAAIESALERTRGNRRRAAETLGIGERTLYRKIKEYGLA
jgi:DNA-binding NtrC family response regulator